MTAPGRAVVEPEVEAPVGRSPAPLTAIYVFAADELARRNRALFNVGEMVLEMTVTDPLRPPAQTTISWAVNDDEVQVRRSHGRWPVDSEPVRGDHPGTNRQAALGAIFLAASAQMAHLRPGSYLRKVSQMSFEMTVTDAGRPFEIYRLTWTAEEGSLLVKRRRPRRRRA